MNNNDDVFLKQMKGVNPIKKNNRIKKDSKVMAGLSKRLMVMMKKKYLKL